MNSEYRYLDELTERYPVLAPVRRDIEAVYEMLKNCFAGGGKLLIAGNGGSCADAEHIVGELMKPGRDPRDELPRPILRTDVLEMKDLKPGMELTGTVRNVIDFGVFVDIGVHQDGLVHISQITDKFIKQPLEAVSVGDIVDVKVMSVDMKKKRIQLTMRGI